MPWLVKSVNNDGVVLLLSISLKLRSQKYKLLFVKLYNGGLIMTICEPAWSCLVMYHICNIMEGYLYYLWLW